MKKLNGFTLIELLAVIAIIGILSIVAVPSVIKIYKQTKLNTFLTQAKNIYKAVSNEVMVGEINGRVISRFYYAKEVSENPVKIKGNDKVYYDVEVSNGKITKISVSDEEFSIQKEDTNGIDVTVLTNTEVKAKEEVGYISVGDGVTYPQEVYGVRFDLSAGANYATRLLNADGKSYSDVSLSNEITSGFDSAQIYKEMVEETDDYGNVFIKIPKFYIKKTVNGNVWEYYVSKEKKDNDYYLPACFIEETTGKIYPYILVGKYNASLNGTKLESKTGKVPLVSRNIVDFRTYATNNGSGYQLLDIHTVDALQTLFYVEYATLNSTSIMYGFGAGLYTATDTVSSINGNTIELPSGRAALMRVGQMIDIGTSQGGRQVATNLRITSINANTITYEELTGISTKNETNMTKLRNGEITGMVYNISYLTGVTDSVRTPSGSYGDNTSGKYPMKYRGIENMYANIWQFIDGINIDGTNHQAYVARDAKNYVSDIITESGGYERVGYTHATAEGSVLTMGYSSTQPFIQLPKTTGSGKYGDYFYRADGTKVAILGGAWSYGTISGISYWYLLFSSSNTYLNIGARFLKTPL